MFRKLQQWLSWRPGRSWEQLQTPSGRTSCFIVQDQELTFEKAMQDHLLSIQQGPAGCIEKALQILELHQVYLDLALQKGWLVPANDVPRQRWNVREELQLEITPQLDQHIEQQLQQHFKKHPRQFRGAREDAQVVYHLLLDHQYRLLRSSRGSG